MAHWGYRIILDRKEHPFTSGKIIEWRAVHEVYYDDDGNIEAWTKEPVTFVSDADLGIDDLIESLRMALKDVEKYPEIDAEIEGVAIDERREARERLEAESGKCGGDCCGMHVPCT